MITILRVMTILAAITVLKNKNPIKWCLVLIAVSLTIFTRIIISSSSRLIPLILLLIFLGGIIIIFIILSSTIPNEISKKSKLNKISLILIATSMSFNYSFLEIPQEYQSIKWFNITNFNIILAISLITLYFVIINIILSNSVHSIRILMC